MVRPITWHVAVPCPEAFYFQTSFLAKHDVLLLAYHPFLASRGLVFLRYLVNGQIDQDEIWARDPIFHNLLL